MEHWKLLMSCMDTNDGSSKKGDINVTMSYFKKYPGLWTIISIKWQITVGHSKVWDCRTSSMSYIHILCHYSIWQNCFVGWCFKQLLCVHRVKEVMKRASDILSEHTSKPLRFLKLPFVVEHSEHAQKGLCLYPCPKLSYIISVT